MEDYKYCIVCGKPYSEEHHVIYRSIAPWMINVRLNKIYLCAEHHRGNNSPHLSKKIDLQYKRELQAKLTKLFNQQYYTVKEIKNILEISEGEAKGIVKTLSLGKEGYSRENIIMRCMGGKNY